MGNIDKFNSIAEQYDTEEREKIATIISNQIREKLFLRREKIAVDYGCGTGLVGINLLPYLQKIIFIDASINMVNQVSLKLKERNITNAEVLCCDFMEYTPKDLHADYIFLVQVLLHEKDIRRLIKQLYSVLNEGGHLVIVDFDKNENIISDLVHNGFLQEELANILQENLFSHITSETFYVGEKLFMNQNASFFIMDAIK